jgi:hypothetical protein
MLPALGRGYADALRKSQFFVGAPARNRCLHAMCSIILAKRLTNFEIRPSDSSNQYRQGRVIR